MDKLLQSSLEKFRQYRSRKLLPVGKFFLKYHITANGMTALSFCVGLAAVYFLFSNHFYFSILALLHLLLDGLDGVIARAATPTRFGKYFDHFSDQMVGFLLIIKIAVVNQDLFVYFIAALVLFSQLFYSLSKMKAPAFFPRSSLIILLLFQQVTLAFLVAGVIGLYSLTMQLVWITARKNT